MAPRGGRRPPVPDRGRHRVGRPGLPGADGRVGVRPPPDQARRPRRVGRPAVRVHLLPPAAPRVNPDEVGGLKRTGPAGGVHPPRRPAGRHAFPSTRSTTQHPRTCGPVPGSGRGRRVVAPGVLERVGQDRHRREVWILVVCSASVMTTGRADLDGRGHFGRIGSSGAGFGTNNDLCSSTTSQDCTRRPVTMSVRPSGVNVSPPPRPAGERNRPTALAVDKIPELDAVGKVVRRGEQLAVGRGRQVIHRVLRTLEDGTALRRWITLGRSMRRRR